MFLLRPCVEIDLLRCIQSEWREGAKIVQPFPTCALNGPSQEHHTE